MTQRDMPNGVMYLLQVRTRQHQLHDEVLLDVQLPIAALVGYNGEQDNVAFQLLDTPGPNEQGASFECIVCPCVCSLLEWLMLAVSLACVSWTR